MPLGKAEPVKMLKVSVSVGGRKNHASNSQGAAEGHGPTGPIEPTVKLYVLIQIKDNA